MSAASSSVFFEGEQLLLLNFELDGTRIVSLYKIEVSRNSNAPIAQEQRKPIVIAVGLFFETGDQTDDWYF